MRRLCLLAGLFYPSGVLADSYTMPLSGYLYVQYAGGNSATANTSFGILSPNGSCNILLTGLQGPTPTTATALAGHFAAGASVNFCMHTTWGSLSGWAYSNGTDLGSRVAFGDLDNSLGFGGLAWQVGGSTLFLDDAVSGLCCDDDDDDIIINLSFAPAPSPIPVPEPGSSGLLLVGLSTLCASRRFFRDAAIGHRPAQLDTYNAR